MRTIKQKALTLISASFFAVAGNAIAAEETVYCYPIGDKYSIDSIQHYGSKCIAEAMNVRPEQVVDVYQITDTLVTANVIVSSNTLSVEAIMFYPDYDYVMQEIIDL